MTTHIYRLIVPLLLLLPVLTCCRWLQKYTYLNIFIPREALNDIQEDSAVLVF